MTHPPMTGAVDLSEIARRRAATPNSLDIKVFVNFGANYYADINDVQPMFGIRDDSSEEPLPALSLFHENGDTHIYVLEKPMQAMLRQALGVPQAVLGLLDKVLAGDEEAIAEARAMVDSIPDEEPAEDTPSA